MIPVAAPRGIIHLRFNTQEALTHAFVRMAEFYESPYDNVRDCRFDLAAYLKRYAADHDGQSYYTEWHGFNIPDHAVLKFADVFADDLTDAEQAIIGMVKAQNERCYLIATHQEDDVTHEIAHGLYYLNGLYRHDVHNLLCNFLGTAACAALRHWLLVDKGYCEKVLLDEYNAYLATNDLAEFQKTIPAAADALFAAGEPFRALFNRFHAL